MGRASLRRFVLLVSAAGFALPVVAPMPPALAAELDQGEIDALVEEGTKWFRTAGDTSLSRGKRNDALKEAYTRLKKAWRILDAYCDAHPEAIERLDAQMVAVNMKLFWIKKEAPVGLLDGSGPPSGSSGGAAGPPPSRPQRPDAPDTPDAPKPPSGRKPAPPAPAPPRSAIEVARVHDLAKPHDVSGSLELWLDVLVEVGDPSRPDYAQALDRVAVLSEKLRDLYRRVREEDPDAIEGGVPPGKEAQVADGLVPGLKDPDPEVRKRAAYQLASLGYTPAALPIYQALRSEKDAGVRDALFLALVRLGGKRTCEALGRFSREKRAPLAQGAVRSLASLARRGPVHARYASLALGDFVATSKYEASPAAALDALIALGPGAVGGLVRAVETRDRALELRAIEALGDTKSGDAAPPLCDRLELKGDEDLRRAAQAALKRIGRASVPALIEALRTKKTRRYAAVALYDITSETFGEDARAWAAWWKDQER